MKLKNRLSLYSVAIFSVIIMVICTVIYGAYFKQIELRESNSLYNKNSYTMFLNCLKMSTKMNRIDWR